MGFCWRLRDGEERLNEKRERLKMGRATPHIYVKLHFVVQHMIQNTVGKSLIVKGEWVRAYSLEKPHFLGYVHFIDVFRSYSIWLITVLADAYPISVLSEWAKKPFAKYWGATFNCSSAHMAKLNNIQSTTPKLWQRIGNNWGLTQTTDHSVASHPWK